VFDSDSSPLRHGLCSGRAELQEQRQGMHLQDLRLWEMSEGTSLLNYKIEDSGFRLACYKQKLRTIPEFFGLDRVLVRLDNVASRIVNADRRLMWSDALHRV